MLYLGRSLCCAFALPMALAAHLKAAEICPPQISTYEKCPGDAKQAWLIPPLPSYVHTDTVIEPLDEGGWEYHWCLKSSTPVKEEIFFIWRDLDVTGMRTGCDGFWGLNLRSRFPPSDLRSTAAVGPDLREIRPHIKMPSDQLPKPWWRQVLDYVTSVFASFPVNKAGDDLVTVGLTIRSIATPVMVDDRYVQTEYRLEYFDPTSDGVSPIRFSFDRDLTERVTELDRLFDVSDKPESLEFTYARPPTNVIGTIVFVGPDDYEVGSMPVSLAVPSD